MIQRIAFIVPGGKSGICGVTDYTFWITAAAVDAGATVLVVCLHGLPPRAYLTRVSPNAQGRMEVSAPDKGRATPEWIARSLAAFEPDWVSLQFSPSDFRTGKMIYPRLAAICTSLSSYPVALTVHESWTQVGVPRSVRGVALALLRRAEVLLALRRLKPALVFASNPHHVRELARAGMRPERLPIFSNVPATPRPAVAPELGSVLASLTEPPPDSPALPQRALIAVFFARIRPEFDPAPVIARLRAEAAAQNRSLVLLSVGETGYAGQGWQRVKAAAAGTACVHLGRRNASEITRLLHAADYGISPTPLPFWQKSSSCAAMLAHGLPLIFSETFVAGNLELPARFATLASDRLEWHDAPKARVATAATAEEIWHLIQTRVSGVF
jgi:hypothetical protein